MQVWVLLVASVETESSARWGMTSCLMVGQSPQDTHGGGVRVGRAAAAVGRQGAGACRGWRHLQGAAQGVRRSGIRDKPGDRFEAGFDFGAVKRRA